MEPTASDLDSLRDMARVWYRDRDPERFKRLDSWLDRCAADLGRQLVIFRNLAPGVWQLGIGHAAPVYRDAPKALEAAYAAIVGTRPAHAAEFVRGAEYPGNALRNTLQRSAIPWIEARCPPLADALRYVRVRRSGALFYDPPGSAPMIVTT
jgi:hypothetical protein